MSDVTIHPREYPRALRNPLMGFRAGVSSTHQWSTLAKVYIPWNAIENDESDTIDKISAYCDRTWRDDDGRGVEAYNTKVIPRVYLHFPQRHEKVWPADMQADDYASDQFLRRVARLSERLAALWDHDPRVAYVEMGLIGKWGEHHSPDLTPEMQKLLGDIFSQRFQNKLVMVRHPWDFQGYRFGIYWDSWAHIQQVGTHGAGIARLGDRWKVAPMGGETAYDWGDYRTQPGDDPNDTVIDPVHRQFLIDSIRSLHCNHLGWVSGYDQTDPHARAGAEQVQKALGYRFVIDELRYPAQVAPGATWALEFTLRNTGSTPLYYNWPVELSLLDPRSRSVVWAGALAQLDTRRWLPGDDWDPQQQAYRVPPEAHTVRGVFTMPSSIPVGEYIVALAILDPAGMLPCVRLAIVNYAVGGRHPLGLIGVGLAPSRTELDEASFDDPAQDGSLDYAVGSPQ